MTKSTITTIMNSNLTIAQKRALVSAYQSLHNAHAVIAERVCIEELAANCNIKKIGISAEVWNAMMAKSY